MFYDARAFAQTLCWKVSGKTIDNMFENTNGGTIIEDETGVCKPDEQ
jgi:hypothetical protein